MNLNEEVELLKKRINREKLARQSAEEILEEKALELYHTNEELRLLNETLEKEILNRTDDLVKSRLRYEQLVESANDIIYEVDANANVIYANQATYRILQCESDELEGRNVFNLIADSHKELVRNSFNDCIKKKEPKLYVEFPCIRKDGEIIWLSQNFQNEFIRINEKSVFKGGKGVARDITSQYIAQKQLEISEEKYRNIMENMDLGYIEVDLNGIIVRAYDKFCQMTGYSKDELIGKVANNILLPEEYKPLLRLQDESRLRGEVSNYEIQMKKKNGDLLWVLISGGPVFDEKGKTIGSVGIHYDLSEQKNVQAELALAKKQAEESQKVEHDFLANMSHEIRTPLNAIIGMSHLLYDTNPSQEQLEYFNIIRNSANFLHTLISDILDMAKIEAGKIEPKSEPFDLIGLLNTLQRTFELKTTKKNLSITIDIDSKIQNLIIGDETLLNQILLNLVGNAEKFTEKGTISLKANIINEENNVCNIQFTVQDTGIGISSERLELIFEKFKQLSSKQQSKTKGTGLGLAIVKELIERMQGSISVKSELGSGSIFSFELPFIKTNTPRKNQIGLLENDATDFSNKRILLVEDNAMNRLYATRLLKKCEVNVIHASDGLEAMKMINKYHFDLILMDIQMPNLDGYETAIQIRNTININKVTPIVALTASALAKEKRKALDAGMNDILTKPFTPEEMNVLLSHFFKDPRIKANLEDNLKNDISINRERLGEIYAGDNDFKKMVFETFLEEIPPQMEEFHLLVKNQNWKEVASLAHRIKPSLGMVGLSEIEEDCRIIEVTIKSDGINEHVIAIAHRCINNFEKYIELIKKELQETG